MARPQILGALLEEAGATEPGAVASALEEQRGSGERLGRILVRRGQASEADVAAALARQLGLSRADEPLRPDPAATELVPAELARTRRVVPLSSTARSLRVALDDPLALATLEDLRFLTGRRIEPVVATPLAMDRGLDAAYGGGFSDLLSALPGDMRFSSDEDTDALAEATRSAPVVRLVDGILHDAVDAGASDIHVEETGGDVRVRYRVDGVLRQAAELPAAARRAVLSRIKVIGGMDISVRRRAQDGRLDLLHDERALTLRVSTLPVNGGEKAVVRILDPRAAPASLETLGMSTADLAGLRRMMAAREGVVLATGPTGSGKSSTLFAALGELDRERLNVVTLEDPVEYRLPGANQVQVDRRAGLGFADALRSVLRQDPDVVMVGEIRDRETAEIAMAAAVTGHLVLSTLHTNDAVGAVTRLVDMGVPPYLVAGGLTGVVAQRLVRRICRTCRGRGCDLCHDGLRGRTGVFQVMPITDPMREAISRSAGVTHLRRLARDGGMGTLAGDARRAVAEGLTTAFEVARVVHSGEASVLPCRGCGAGVPVGALGCPSCGTPHRNECVCGATLERGWRYCASCLRKAS